MINNIIADLEKDIVSLRKEYTRKIKEAMANMRNLSGDERKQEGFEINKAISILKRLDEESKIDYKKLLTICLEAWLENEGVCWGGDDYEKNRVTDEEREEVRRIVNEIEPDHF